MGEKIDYSDIIEELYNFIYFDEIDDGYLSLEQLVLSEKFCNMILNSFDFRNFCMDPKLIKTISKEKTIQYTTSFLSSIKEDYVVRMNDNIKDGILKFTTVDECKTGYITMVNGRSICVPLRYDLSDTFTLTHEQIHDTTMTDENMSATWLYFTETPTMLAELLEKDYLKDNGINDRELKKHLRYTTSSYVYRALMLKTQIDMLKEILTNGYIDKFFLLNLIIEINDICHDEYLTCDAIDDSIAKLFGYDECFYLFDLRYIIGGILSAYLHDKIIDNPKLLKEFSKYNESFMNLDIQGVFESIGLNFKEDEMDIIDEDYKKLEKCYKKELNRMW